MRRVLRSVALATPAVLLAGCGDQRQQPASASAPRTASAPLGPNGSALQVKVSLPELPWAKSNPLPWASGSSSEAPDTSGTSGTSGAAHHTVRRPTAYRDQLNATGIAGCPAGYMPEKRPPPGVHVTSALDSLRECGLKCDRAPACQAFMYSPSEKRCVVLHHKKPGDGLRRDYQFCQKRLLRHFQPQEAPLFGADEYVQQEGAEFPVGEEIHLYAVGSSSLLWMTWLDQLHLVLRRLGYRLPFVPATTAARLYPKQAPSCDDTKYFEYLKTTRFGRIGWSSWDFAFEGWEGCEDGYRLIAGTRVKCQHGAGCSFGKEPVKASDIAADAAKSNITLVATWFNDDQQWSTHFKCFGGVKQSSLEVAPLSIDCLLRTIRSIHEKNPNVWVLVMGKYPQTYRHITYPFLNTYNARVRKAVEQEPKTLFIEFYMPNAGEGSFYQIAHSGHPNCRGSKIMAYAVMARLYKMKVLARSIGMEEPDSSHVLNPNCTELTNRACHTSALCWLDPEDRHCKAYSAGTWNYHTVCEGTICSRTTGQFV